MTKYFKTSIKLDRINIHIVYINMTVFDTHVFFVFKSLCASVFIGT